MPKKKRLALDGFIPSGTVLAIRLLLILTSALASYLVWVSFAGGAIAGCGPASGCQAVLKSRWAYWFGVPVSLPALLLYLTVLATTLEFRAGKPAANHRRAWRAILPAAWMIVGAALWFVILQLLVLRRVCPFCMTAHGLGLIAALLFLRFAPFRPEPEKPWEKEKQVFIPPPLSRKLFLVGLAGFIGLVAGQTLYQRPTYSVKSVAGGLTQGTSNSGQRVLKVFDGKVELNLDELPVLGSPDSPNVILSLFDYTCHFCRVMHPRLREVQKAYSNRVAIVHLPMPLDEKCNFTLNPGGTPKEHTNACRYATLGLAVWRANRAKLAEFDEQMFKTEQVLSYETAFGLARQLVGEQALAQAMEDPWIKQQIAKDVVIYSISYMQYKNGSMPQLIIGTNIFSGTLDTNQLHALFKSRK